MENKFSPKLKNLLESIKKTQGDEIVVDLINSKSEYPRKCSWGSITMDIASGGGVPNRIIEIMGMESSGKSTLVLTAIREAQKEGHICAYIDTEHAFDKTYAENLGVDCNNLIFLQPDNAESAFNAMETLAKSGEVGLVALDSIASMASKAELDGESGDLKVAGISRLMAQHCRKIVSVAKQGVTLIYVNQFRDKINTGMPSYGGPQNTTPGGQSMKFYASQRIEIKRVGRLDAGDKDYFGNEVMVEFKKNKLAPPFKKAYFSIIYGEGISKESEILNAALDLELIVKTGSGPAPNFDTPIHKGAIESTEAKTMEALSKPEFIDLALEIEYRVKLAIKEISQDKFDEVILPLHQKYVEIEAKYLEFMKESNYYSGKSKHIESRYYAILANELRPVDKISAKKVVDMEKKINERRIKGDKTISGSLVLEDGRTLIVEDGEIVEIQDSNTNSEEE